MALKPFKIVEIPPDPPSADELARQHHLSKQEKSVIQRFVFSVRGHSETFRAGARKSAGIIASAKATTPSSGKSTNANHKGSAKVRSRSGERVATRKK